MATQITNSCGVVLTSIAGNDCIGDSRVFINNNFLNLASTICTLTTNLTSLSSNQNTRTTLLSTFVKSLSAKDSPTIDISFNANTYFLSADVQNNSIGLKQLNSDITTFGRSLLTSTSIALSSLQGITLTSTPILDQVIGWNGATWTNVTFSQLTGLLTDGNKGDISVNVGTNTWTILSGAVTESKILNGAVNELKLSDNAVSTNKIQDSAVTETKIQGSVSDVNDSSRSITSSKIRNLSITETKIAPDAVTTAKIANATNNTTGITNPKLRHSTGCSIIGRNINTIGAPADIIANTDNTVLVRANNELQFGVVPNTATTATSSSTPSTIVLRNTFGDFSANTINATLFVGNIQGNVTGNILGNVTGNLSALPTQPLILSTDTIPRIFITSTGNVGIGTTSPQETFHVITSTNNCLLQSVTNEVALNLLTNEGINNNVKIVNLTGGRAGIVVGNTTEAFSITKNGNVGIGITSPTERLHISGNITLSNTIRMTGNSPTLILSHTTNRTGFIHVDNNNLYILAGPANSQQGQWFGTPFPLTINLVSNETTFGGGARAPHFIYSNNSYDDVIAASDSRTFNANSQQLVRWSSNYTGNRSIYIDNLTSGKTITIFHENTDGISSEVRVYSRKNTTDPYELVPIAEQNRLQQFITVPQALSQGNPGVIILQITNFDNVIRGYETLK